MSLPTMANTITEHHQNSITSYMYLGLLPFFAGAIGPWLLPEIQGQLNRFFLFYSSIVLVFLAGGIWALALLCEIENQHRHSHAAIVFSLWPLPCFFLSDSVAAGLLLAGFLVLLFWEKCFFDKIYPAWYRNMRHKITFIVVACHMLVVWNLLGV